MTQGIAKKKLFGQQQVEYPRLQKLIKEKALLAIDLAYAKLQEPNGLEEEVAIHAALLAAARNGHLYLDKGIAAEISPELATLIPEGKIYYLPKFEKLEDQIVSEIKRLLSLPQKPHNFEPIPSLTQEQNTAVENALQCPISLITGGPGTGKTHTANAIASALNVPTLLAAPTGKAAAHLESKVKTNAKAQTLHRLLEITGPQSYKKDVKPLKEELIVVDECSMIEPALFARLLRAVGPNSTLVLMGDSNQLPAVQGGSIFHDLIESKTIPTATLTKCMRSDLKQILDLASNILQGKARDMINIDLGFNQKDIQLIYQKLFTYVKTHFQIDDMDHFRILSTLRKGPLGVDALNAYFHEEFSKTTNRFPIMITRNAPEHKLFNGDTGVLIEGKEAVFPHITLPIEELPSYEYAYCISVHKSQGSEYNHVLFLIPEGSEAFGKEVLYTAVTRAKHKLEIDGNKEQIQLALTRNSLKRSKIAEKLKLGVS